MLKTLARPYAKAAFEYALDKNAISAWESILREAAQLAKNPLMVTLLSNPDVTPSQCDDLFCEALSPLFTHDEQRNFFHLLAENRRLPLLSDIFELFMHFNAAHEKTVEIALTSAIPLDDSYQKRFKDALEKRFGQHVAMTYTVDSTLLGGAIIRIGDKVIDGSIRGKLNRLQEFI